MSKTITVSDETYALIKEQVEKDNKESSKTKIQIKTIAGEVIYESKKTTIKDTVVEAVGKGVDLEGADLRGVDLRGAYLEGADLRGVDLRGAYLSGADLEGADFRGADLRGACLERAYLKGASLERTDLRGTDLRGAYLRGAYLERTDLRGTDLRGADFFQTKFLGKGGATKIKKNQIGDFFKALGVIVED